MKTFQAVLGNVFLINMDYKQSVNKHKKINTFDPRMTQMSHFLFNKMTFGPSDIVFVCTHVWRQYAVFPLFFCWLQRVLFFKCTVISCGFITCLNIGKGMIIIV